MVADGDKSVYELETKCIAERTNTADSPRFEFLYMDLTLSPQSAQVVIILQINSMAAVISNLV